MLSNKGEYLSVVVESYLPTTTAGSSSPIRIRPVAGQGFSTSLNVECDKRMRAAHPVGTRFRIRAKLTSKDGGTPYLYSHHSRDYEVMPRR